eukprot:UN03184
MKHVYYLMEGQAEMTGRLGGRINMIYPGRGGWIGEFFDPNRKPEYYEKEHRWCIGTKALEKCKLARFDQDKLQKAIERNPRLVVAAGKAENSDLWCKIRQNSRHRAESVYSHMMKIASLGGTLSDKARGLLAEYKQTQLFVTDETHEKSLKEIGWTQKEFDNGQKIEVLPD